jgi:hypothetical protein
LAKLDRKSLFSQNKLFLTKKSNSQIFPLWCEGEDNNEGGVRVTVSMRVSVRVKVMVTMRVRGEGDISLKLLVWNLWEYF